MRKGARVGAVSAGTPRRGGSSIGGTFTLVHAVALAAGVTGLTALGLASKLASGPHAPLRGGLGVGGGATVIRGWEAAGGSANNPAWRGVAAAGGLGGAAGAQPPPTPSPDWRYRFSVVAPPSPSPLPIIYNLRGCTCASNAGGCSCGGVACPAYVTAKYLTDAVGQDACSLRRPTGFTCTAKCQPDDKPVLWFAGGCGGAGQGPCDPLVVPASATASPTGPPLPSIVVPRTSWVPDEVYDFRGGGCELLNGKEQCYMEDGQGRELCPESVTLDLMVKGPPEYPQCAPSQSEAFYCTIICQQDNPTVRWGVHNIEECYKAENRGNCPPRHKVIPKSQWQWREWSEKKRPETHCQAAARLGHKGEMVEGLTVGLLTHEPRSFAESMASYEKHGLFDVVREFVIFINNRNPETDAVAEGYAAKRPGLFKVLGSEQNVGITHGMLALTAAATQPYFLFMERDFQLVEPQTCVSEELRAGVDLIKAGEAHVVRYRHKWRAGRPNWAYRFFAGHEDDAFRTWQPNLGCNVHYWIEDPVARFPQYFWRCGQAPEMLCSDSYYCNWTNNPQLWSIAWWNKEYVQGSFKHSQRLDPYDNLETWFNWEPNSWNDRGFTVAQGAGLFKHRDLGNIVHV